MIFPTPYLLAGALTVGLLTGWTANGWRLNGKIDEMVLEHTQAVQVATEQAAAKTQQMQEEKDAALKKAVEIVRRNVIDADAARNERDRLRDDLIASRATFSEATDTSLAQYTNTLSVVFEQCTREYSELAAKADGHATDAQSLFNAWTAISAVR